MEHIVGINENAHTTHGKRNRSKREAREGARVDVGP